MDRRTWVNWSLGVYVLVAAVVLLAPVTYSDIVIAIWMQLRALGLDGFGAGWVEFVANVFMFLPLGLLLTLFFRRPWIGFALALLVSVGAELAQRLIPGRLASPRDVLANALGAALGALIAWFIVAFRRARDDKHSQSS